MKRLHSLLALCFSAFWATCTYALKPIVPEMVLSPEQINEVIRDQNYFFYKTMEENTPIWHHTNRQYGGPFLRPRSRHYTIEEVLHHVLTSSFTIAQRMEALYRAKLGIPGQLGEIVPNLEIPFGQGATFDAKRIFAGLYNFVLPQNWMRLASRGKGYKVARYLLLSTILDEIQRAKLLYITQHQRIQDYEILNFYFIHLQLLGRMYPQGSREIDTMLGTYGQVGTDVASLQGEAKQGYNDIALQMALEKVGPDFSASLFNIEDISNFPREVPDSSELPAHYNTKEKFIELAVQRSVEIKTLRELYSISKLDVGITAFGSLFGVVDRPADSPLDARFIYRFGLGTIPSILIARSSSRSARIDVQRQFVAMLDMARRIFDAYPTTSYTEAKRSLALNRKAFRENLEELVRTKRLPDAMFILSFNQLIYAELRFNNSLHNLLRAHANMDRLLLHDIDIALQHVPAKKSLAKFFRTIANESQVQMQRETSLDIFLAVVHKAEELQIALFNQEQHPVTKNYNAKELQKAVVRNMMKLLQSRVRSHKCKHFYRIVQEYIRQNQLEITHLEQHILDRKVHGLWCRLFHKQRDWGIFQHKFDYKDFGKQQH